MPPSYHNNNSGCGKREARIKRSMATCKGGTRYWNYLENNWPCAGGLSAVNTIATQLRVPINSELTRWRMLVPIKEIMVAAAEIGRNPASKHQIRHGE